MVEDAIIRAFEIYKLVKKPMVNFIDDEVLFEWHDENLIALLVKPDKYILSSVGHGNFLYQFTSKEWTLEQLGVMGLIQQL